MKKNLLSVLVLLPVLNLTAQVEHKPEWKPVREVTSKAPAPPRLDERVRNFEQRDSDESVAQLARQLFGLINPAHVPEDAGQAAIYRDAWKQFRAGKYREALEAYKHFSFERIRKPAAGVKIDAVDPAKRVFIEFYNQPDEMMKGIFRFQVFDKPIPPKVAEDGTDAIINYYRAGKHNAHMVDIVLQNGQPGRMNWTYVTPGYTSGTWHIRDEKGFAAYSYRQGTCFSALLAAYMEKNDPAYLNQWLGYTEDLLLNYRKDLAEAGILMPVNSAGAGGPDIRHLFWLILKAPNIDRDFPATTYARLQLRYWVEDLPLILLGSRATGANRAMHMYGALITDYRMRFPELNCADSLIEERRRILESYARQYMMPDGTSIDYAPNYNKNYILCPPNDVKFYSEMKNPPPWFTKDWIAESERERRIMARYLIHSIAPDGTLPGYKDPERDLLMSTIGKDGYITKSLPSALTDPVNKAVVANLLAKSAVEDPGYTSEAFPYGGYYIMRENWNRDARYLYFHDYRPAENGNWRHHKNIYLQAFGQRMLNSFRWESPLLVDGAGNMHESLFDLYPEELKKRGIFGTHAEHSAWQEPLPSRWHTSARFDLAEADLKMPYAQKFDDKPPVFVDDVAHARQVVFLRDAGAWIVTDRITAGKPHDYRLVWGFEPDRLNPPGWEKDFRNKNKKEGLPREEAYSKEQIVVDAKSRAIRTENPKRPNLSIYHAASLPIQLKPGDITQNNDAMFGNNYQTGPRFRMDRSAVVASLLYPRNTGAADMAEFVPVAVPDGAAFDAKTPEGVAVQYRAGLAGRDLEAGPVKARAATLVVSRPPGRPLAGIALDCTELHVDGTAVAVPSADFEFSVDTSGKTTFENIRRPMPPVRILPERNVFVGEVEATFEHPAKDVDIRYTLDGSEPTVQSPLYTKPVRLTQSATVRAVAFRHGLKTTPITTDSTQASVSSSAFFTKAPSYWPAIRDGGSKPGLVYRYFEDDWSLSILKLPILKPLAEGVASKWMDISAVKKNANTYALVYEGFLKVPKNGIYTFHGPWEFYDVGERAAYDLQITVDGRVWYPSTKAHNYGNWSIPLAEGSHALKVTYVDIRRGTKLATFPTSFNGEKPEIRFSGPGLEPGEVPAAWLFYK